MIYLFFVIPFVIGLVLVFGSFHFGFSIDTNDWSLVPTIRVGYDLNDKYYYLSIDFLCFLILIGVSKNKVKQNINNTSNDNSRI